MKFPLDLIVAIAVFVIVFIGWVTTPFEIWLLVLVCFAIVPAAFFITYYFRKR